MPKTKRTYSLRLQTKSAASAERIRASFQSPLLKDLKMWNETLSDEEFESQLQKTEIGLQKAALLNQRNWPGNPASWGPELTRVE
jgi:hypothetical protein